MSSNSGDDGLFKRALSGYRDAFFRAHSHLPGPERERLFNERISQFTPSPIIDAPEQLTKREVSAESRNVLQLGAVPGQASKHSIQLWQRDTISEDQIEEGIVIADIYAQCSSFYRLVLQRASSSGEVPRNIYRRLESTYGSLVLWADGHGISEGALDALVSRSHAVRQVTLRLLASITTTLLDSRSLALGQQDRLADPQQGLRHESYWIPAILWSEQRAP